jgi:hypothetical protein
VGKDRDGITLKSADQCGLVIRDMYDRMYCVFEIDLQKYTNENIDSV